MSAVLDALNKENASISGVQVFGRYAKAGWPRIYLRALAQCGDIVESARVAKVHPVTVRRYRGQHPRFAERERQAKEDYADLAVGRIESALDDRAVNGRSRTIIHKGEPITVHDKPSDKAAEIRLKALRPEVYDRRRDQPVGTVNIVVNDNSRTLLMSHPDAIAAACTLAKLRTANASSASQAALPSPPQDHEICLEG